MPISSRFQPTGKMHNLWHDVFLVDTHYEVSDYGTFDLGYMLKADRLFYNLHFT